MLLVPVPDQEERVYLNTYGLGPGCGNAFNYCLDCQDPDIVKPGKRFRRVVMSAGLNVKGIPEDVDLLPWMNSVRKSKTKQ